MLGSVTIDPNLWPTSAVLDWVDDPATGEDRAGAEPLSTRPRPCCGRGSTSRARRWARDGAARRPLVADGLRGLNAARLLLAVAGTPALARRRAAAGARAARPAAARALGHHGRERLGHARVAALLGAVRVDAGRPAWRPSRSVRRGAWSGTRRAASRRFGLPWPERRAELVVTHAGTADRGCWCGRTQRCRSRAAVERLQDQAHADAGRAAGSGPLEPRRRAARPSRDGRADRHGLGGGRRPGARRGDHPRQRPRRPVAAAGRARTARRAGVAGVRGTALRGLPGLLPVRAQGPLDASSTRCDSTTPASSSCRQPGSKPCTRRRCSASCRTRRSSRCRDRGRAPPRHPPSRPVGARRAGRRASSAA